MIMLSKRAQLMMRYAAEAKPDWEVSGFGRVSLHDGLVEVIDIIIPPQEVGSVHTDIKPDTITNLMSSLAGRKDQQTLADWRCWWHSHGRLGTEPSAQDTETIRDFASMRGMDWAIGIVTNSKRDYSGFLGISKPFPLTITKIDVLLEEDEDEKLKASVTNMMSSVSIKEPMVSLLPSYKGYEGQVDSYKLGRRGFKGPGDILWDDDDILDLAEQLGITFAEAEEALRSGEWPITKSKSKTTVTT